MRTLLLVIALAAVALAADNSPVQCSTLDTETKCNYQCGCVWDNGQATTKCLTIKGLTCSAISTTGCDTTVSKHAKVVAQIGGLACYRRGDNGNCDNLASRDCALSDSGTNNGLCVPGTNPLGQQHKGGCEMGTTCVLRKCSDWTDETKCNAAYGCLWDAATCIEDGVCSNIKTRLHCQKASTKAGGFETAVDCFWDDVSTPTAPSCKDKVCENLIERFDCLDRGCWWDGKSKCYSKPPTCSARMTEQTCQDFKQAFSADNGVDDLDCVWTGAACVNYDRYFFTHCAAMKLEPSAKSDKCEKFNCKWTAEGCEVPDCVSYKTENECLGLSDVTTDDLQPNIKQGKLCYWGVSSNNKDTTKTNACFPRASLTCDQLEWSDCVPVNNKYIADGCFFDPVPHGTGKEGRCLPYKTATCEQITCPDYQTDDGTDCPACRAVPATKSKCAVSKFGLCQTMSACSSIKNEYQCGKTNAGLDCEWKNSACVEKTYPPADECSAFNANPTGCIARADCYYTDATGAGADKCVKRTAASLCSSIATATYCTEDHTSLGGNGNSVHSAGAYTYDIESVGCYWDVSGSGSCKKINCELATLFDSVDNCEGGSALAKRHCWWDEQDSSGFTQVAESKGRCKWLSIPCKDIDNECGCVSTKHDAKCLWDTSSYSCKDVPVPACSTYTVVDGANGCNGQLTAPGKARCIWVGTCVDMTTSCPAILGPHYCDPRFVHPTTGEAIGNAGCQWNFFESKCYMPTAASNTWTSTNRYTECINNMQSLIYQCLDPNGKVLDDEECAVRNKASRPCTSYVWIPSEWSPCTQAQQTRSIGCYQEGTVTLVEDMYCNTTAKPVTIAPCRNYFFNYGPFGACQANCIQSTAAAPCVYTGANNVNITVDDTLCYGDKIKQQVCYGGLCPLKVGAGNMLTFSALAVAIATLFALL